MTLLTATLSNRYTLASVATIKRHIASTRGLDETAALRLLRRNVRDSSPHASRALQWSVAREVLDMIKGNQI